MTLQPGDRPVPNSPDYVLIRKLGAGAFGEVWQTRGPGGFDVALKVIRLDANVLAAELRSLDVMKTIRHPNLVSLFGAWQHDNCLILAMELCDCTLQDRLKEAHSQGLGGIPTKELLDYMRDAASGLDALNARQVQHRDVKPANLLLLNSGVKVADYGLAKAIEQTVASNSGAGTLAYMAPECFKGELTQYSDQYSLAVTYYHLRTGKALFTGNQAEIVYGHLESEPDLSMLPTREKVALARALAKEPGKRWQDCSTFIDEMTSTKKADTRKPRKNLASQQVSDRRGKEDKQPKGSIARQALGTKIGRIPVANEASANKKASIEDARAEIDEIEITNEQNDREPSRVKGILLTGVATAIEMLFSTLLGLLILYLGVIAAYVDCDRFINEGRETTATVDRPVEFKNVDRRGRFSSSTMTRVTYDGHEGFIAGTFTINKISVIYLPSEPQKVITGKRQDGVWSLFYQRQGWIGPLLCCILGFAALTFALACAILPWLPNRRMPWQLNKDKKLSAQ